LHCSANINAAVVAPHLKTGVRQTAQGLRVDLNKGSQAPLKGTLGHFC
jgi:hypothetical protein